MENYARRFSKMYREQNFMHGRDIPAYLKRQSDSCIFLINRFGLVYGLCKPEDRLRLVLRHLAEVHTRQYDELGLVCTNGEPSSFYFGRLLEKSHHLHPMVVEAIAYERGRQRYVELVETGETPWRNFLRDATLNRDLCVSYLFEEHGYLRGCEMIEEMVAIESTLVETIDLKKLEN